MRGGTALCANSGPTKSFLHAFPFHATKPSIMLQNFHQPNFPAAYTAITTNIQNYSTKTVSHKGSLKVNFNL
jgi:hypothetical protein